VSSPSSYAVFRLVSADGDQGFPGKLVTEALVALIEPGDQDRKYRKPGDTAENEEYDLGSVAFIYRAKLEKGDKEVVTPVNLTQVSFICPRRLLFLLALRESPDAHPARVFLRSRPCPGCVAPFERPHCIARKPLRPRRRARLREAGAEARVRY
jgi:hypothetical protein